MLLFALSIVLFPFVIAPGCAQGDEHPDELVGGWKGVWTKDGDSLPVTVTFTRAGDAYSGMFDSDALQVAGIPLDDVSGTHGSVHFQLRGDQSTTVFDGTITGAKMSGTFTDGSVKGSFELARAVLPAAQIRARDVTFQNKDTSLAGTLWLPDTPGKHAAIVFLHGSGPEGRWANRYLAQKFAQHGIVALIYDKRGVGQSAGDWQKASIGDLADDAVAGIRFLQTQSAVDAARVGIYGHSQGGTIAPLVGVRAGDLRFVIASAAGGIDPADVEIYSVGNSIGVARLPPAERADAQGYVQALVDVAYRGHDRAQLDVLAAKFKSRDWYFDPPPPDNSYWLISRSIAAFHPVEYWRQIKAPVLLIYGAHDDRVPPRESANAIQSALKSAGNRNVTLKMYPHADHTFTLVDPPHKGGWPKHEPDYAGTLVQWVLAQL
jgi:dipeptidyl aminopeptidase/acylaminoacyl peptidase